MESQKFNTIAALCLFSFSLAFSVGSYLILQDAQATGGAGEIKGLIDPIIDRAITALQQNNTELALEEIETLKNELDDTFAVDSKEEKDDDDD
jgi:phage gp29-like protein